MKRYKKKRILPAVVAVIFAGMVLLIGIPGLAQEKQQATFPVLPTQEKAATSESLTQNKSVTKATSNSSSGGIKGLGVTGLTLVAGFLLVLRTFLTVLVNIAGWLLNIAFDASSQFLSIQKPAVQAGWGTIRDITNAFFILIVLWIAFTIIFNLENFGGKKLLVRVIIVALLVNFSLAIVTAVFGFANAIADPFRKHITQQTQSEGGVSEYIITTTQAMTIFKKATPQEVNKYKNLKEQTTGSASPSDSQSAPIINQFKYRSPGFKDTLLASLGIPTSRAGALEGFKCAFAFIFGAESCFKLLGFEELAEQINKSGVGALETAYRIAVALSIQLVVLAVLLATFLIGAIIFIARAIAAIFLSILAPLAFLMFILPANIGKKYWDMWLHSVFKWAFIAPIFYFFLLIGLALLGEYASATIDVGIFKPDVIIITILVGGFIFAAAWISLKLSGKFGEMSVGFTKGAVFAMAAGGAMLAAAGAKRTIPRIAPPEGRVARGLRKIAATRGLRWLGGGIPHKRYAEVIAQRRGEVDKQLQKVSIYSKEDTITRYRSAINRAEKMALLKRIVDNEWLGDAKLSPREMRAATALAEQFGMHQELAKKSLNFITPDNYQKFYPDAADFREARRRHLDKLTPKAIAEISDSMVDVGSIENQIKDARAKGENTKKLEEELRNRMALAENMWKNLGASYFSAIQRENPTLMEKLIEALNKNTEQARQGRAEFWTRQMRPDTYRFMQHNIHGLYLPESSPPPQGLEDEKLRRWQENLQKQRTILSAKENSLASYKLSPDANQQEIAEREKEIHRLQRRINELEALISSRGATS